MPDLKLKRVYLPAAKADGYRILVDRVWPRGVTKAKAKVDEWLREVAPTDALRKWFAHDREKWPEFKQRYLKEITANKAAVQKLVDAVKAHPDVTILFGARDEECNQAVVLSIYLKRRLGR
ncbi:MAG: DUF488 domain-containing protein [Gammaproteobacteria bacterium]